MNFKRKAIIIALNTTILISVSSLSNVFGTKLQTLSDIIADSAAPVYADEALVTPQPIVQTLDEAGTKDIEITNVKKTIYDFKDGTDVEWAIEPITWGLENDVIAGYTDGTFRPTQQLRESEFATMFAKYATNTDRNGFIAEPGEHWSQGYYDELYKFNMPVRGNINNQFKETSITRKQVAMIVAAKYGFNLTEKQAVYFMYENGLSRGMRTGERSFDSYGPNLPLTRAEAITFMLSIDNMGDKVMTFKGNTSIKGVPKEPRDILGIEWVDVNNKIMVDFSDFDAIAKEEQAMVPVGIGGYDTTITTKVVGDKVVAVQTQKITESMSIEEDKEKYVSYYDANNYVDAYCFNNSIVLYKGVELPISDGFILPEDMMIDTDGNSLGGLVGIEYTGNQDVDAGGFIDKTAFNSLMQNLKFFKASPKQIEKAIEMVNTQGGVSRDLIALYLYNNISYKPLSGNEITTADIEQYRVP